MSTFELSAPSVNKSFQFSAESPIPTPIDPKKRIAADREKARRAVIAKKAEWLVDRAGDLASVEPQSESIDPPHSAFFDTRDNPCYVAGPSCPSYVADVPASRLRGWGWTRLGLLAYTDLYAEAVLHAIEHAESVYRDDPDFTPIDRWCFVADEAWDSFDDEEQKSFREWLGVTGCGPYRDGYTDYALWQDFARWCAEGQPLYLFSPNPDPVPDGVSRTEGEESCNIPASASSLTQSLDSRSFESSKTAFYSRTLQASQSRSRSTESTFSSTPATSQRRSHDAIPAPLGLLPNSPADLSQTEGDSRCQASKIIPTTNCEPSSSFGNDIATTTPNRLSDAIDAEQSGFSEADGQPGATRSSPTNSSMSTEAASSEDRSSSTPSTGFPVELTIKAQSYRYVVHPEGDPACDALAELMSSKSVTTGSPGSSVARESSTKPMDISGGPMRSPTLNAGARSTTETPSPSSLIIRGDAYHCVVQPEGIELTSPSGEVHYIVDGECSCRDAFFRERVCKHARALINAGLVEERTMVYA